MNKIFTAAIEVQTFCEGQGWRFCIIGGVAVYRWGEIRVTRDVDLTLLTGIGSEESYIDRLLARFAMRPPCTREFALLNRVLLLVNAANVPLDIALGAFDFEERSISRSSIWLPDGKSPLRTCSAEDLVVHKCFAGRDLDWVDVDGILARQWGKLDLDLIRTELVPLLELKGELESLQRLEKLFVRHTQPFRIISRVGRRAES